jgi:hypothetical protein
VIFEAIPQFLGLLQLVALRELIDSFEDGPDGDKSYAYLMCTLLLLGQAAEGKSPARGIADGSDRAVHQLVGSVRRRKG